MSRTTFWNTTTSVFCIWLCHIGFSQSCVQRLLSLPSLKHAKRSMNVFLVGVIGIMSINCFTGIIMYAYYHYCDPVKANIVTKYDKLMPRFVQDVAGHITGMSGMSDSAYALRNFNHLIIHQVYSYHACSAPHSAPFLLHYIRYLALFTTTTFDQGNGLPIPIRMPISRCASSFFSWAHFVHWAAWSLKISNRYFKSCRRSQECALEHHLVFSRWGCCIRGRTNE